MTKDKFNTEFLEFLVCPKNGSKLIYDDKKNILISKDGKNIYKIESGIPKLV